MAIKEAVLLLSIIMLPLVTEALRLVGPGDSIEIGEGSDEMCLKEGLKEDVAAIMRRLEDLAAKVESCGRGQNGWVSDGISSYRMLSRRYKTMADARQQCQNLGADLPIISSSKENNFIADLLAKEGKTWAWVGLQRNIVDLEFYWVNGSKLGDTYDASNDEEPNSGGGVEGKFHAWSDGEPNNGGRVEGGFHAWNEGEPNNSGGVEYCAYIMGQVSHKGKWNDCPCKLAADLVSPYVLCQKAI